jgi:hypothetical protein
VTKAYHWVLADRDKSPDLPKRYDVNAYPTLLVLGIQDENVHRWEGYRKAPEFGGELVEGLRRFALHRAGGRWDEPAPRPARICDQGELANFRAPSEDVPCGMTFVGEDLWIAQGGKLRRLDAKHAVAAEFPISASVLDLTSDGRLLYAVESGWTAGEPIRVIDPATGAETRAIVTEANRSVRSHGAKGIVWRDGRLFVLDGMQGLLRVVDPATGAVERTLTTGATWLTGLDFDGTSFVTGSRTELLFLDAASGAVTRRVPVNYPLRNVAARPAEPGRVWLLEQPVFGHDRLHRSVRVWPRETVVHVLTFSRAEPAPAPAPATPR